LSEARDRYEALLRLDTVSVEAQSVLLGHLSDVEDKAGNLDAAEALATRAVVLAESLVAPRALADALRNAAWIASHRGDSDHAASLARCAVEVANTLDPPTRVHALHDLGVVLTEGGRLEEARSVLQQAADEAHAEGLVFPAAFALLNLGKIDVVEHRYESAHAVYESARQQSVTLDHYELAAFTCWGLGISSLGLARQDEARSAFAEMLDRVLSSDQETRPILALTAAGVALSVRQKDVVAAARLLGAVATMREGVGAAATAQDVEVERRFEPRLSNALGDGVYADERALGAAMTQDEAIELACLLAERHEATPAEQAPPR
jgi:tetratricopeptide (TPR) repeat protein